MSPKYGHLLAQERGHPRIYVTDKDKQGFLHSLKQAKWKENLEKYLELFNDDPTWLVSRLQMNWKTRHNKVFLRSGNFSHSDGNAPVPTVRFSGTRDWATDYMAPPLEEIEPYFDDERGMYLMNKSSKEKEWVHPSKTGHIIERINERIMNLVEDAAFLYWLTGEKKYAEFAAPVFDTYMMGMFHRDAPFDQDNSNQQRISGLATFEVIHERIVIPLTTTYDFMFDYLNENKYDRNVYISVFQKWADQIIINGIPDNNWNFFQARFLTYIALALDDDENYKNGKGQQYYLNEIFDVSSERQIALKEAILVYDQNNGIWPESPSYSMHDTTTLLRILFLLDNVTNNNEFKNYPIIEKASLAAFQYLFPNGYTVGFGDTKHSSIPTETFELLIANYRKYGETEKELQLSGLLNNSLEENESRKRGKDLFELFFYVDTFKETKKLSFQKLLGSLASPTFYAPNVSLFIQRMGSENDAMMVSTVGSLGNHAHANGIALELYANNYVLGPDMGKGPSYWHDDHRDYYSQLPAHNTVVVDGISSYEKMRSYHPFSLDNHFPKLGETNPVFKEVSFSKVSFVEPKTLSDQQRLTAMINSDAGNGYILDVFRSKKQHSVKQKHEYFYHNLGQSLTFLGENEMSLTLAPTDELGTSHGDIKAYDYLSEKQSLSTSKDIKAVFTLESEGQSDNLMKMWIKGGVDQQFFSAMSPKSNALTQRSAPKEMMEQKIPTLIIRKNQEAWTEPFVAIFNPHIEGENQIISSIDFEESTANKAAQVITVKHNDAKTEDYIVVTSSVNDVVNDEDYYLRGLLTIRRTSGNHLDFIFAAGTTRYKYGGWSIISIDKPATVSIEKSGKGFVIQNDQPVVIGIPKNLNPTHIEFYNENERVGKRVGFVNRNNSSQVDFRLEKPYQKAIVVLGE